MNRKIIYWVCFVGIFSVQTHIILAQVQSGQLNYESLGIQLAIPEGWTGQETNDGLILGHSQIPGLLLISTNSYKKPDEIRKAALAGIHDDNGTNLQPSGSLESWEDKGLGAEYSGIMEWEPVTFYVLAIINDYGYGLTIMAGTTKTQYSPIYKDLVYQVASSTKFSESKAGSEVLEWKDWLKNKRLTYMNSYYSSGSGTDGYTSGGGYSTTIRIDLCEKGYFRYSESSDVSVDTGGAYGYSNNDNEGNGTWKVMGNAKGGATLILTFNNGEIYEYELSYEQQKTYLNGERYYVTDGSSGADDGPKCY